MSIDYSEKIPNNVDIAGDRKLQRALESWQPNFLNWWKTMGPAVPTEDVYLRTAVAVGREGWAHFDHVAMEEYRWGVFLAERNSDRRIAFGEQKGEPVWQQVPGEYRADLQRLIVIQGDTEPASVEQQRRLGETAPSLYDLRNLFQVNVEEGRHLWAGPGARRPRRCCSATPATSTRRASSAPSTRRPPTGSRSSCSPTSPTGTASTSSAR
jgi:benzoyl-CoA 2,3-dioxygenase component B